MSELSKAVNQIATAFKQLAEHILKVWKSVKDALADIAHIPKKNKRPERYTQTKWAALQDMRFKNQVTCNKPRHLIKKIIR